MSPLLNDNKMLLELKSRRMCYNNELESTREEFIGEIGMHQETTNVLYQPLSQACHERDEAKEQLKKSMAEISELKKLLNKLLIPSSNISAETNKSSDNVSSTVGDGICRKMLKTPFVEDTGGRIPMGKCSSIGNLIDTLIKGKPLPEKGKLLEAVIDTAPLLETLMITGQLPNWRNPPPLPFNLVVNGDHTTIPNSQKCSKLKSMEHAGS